MDTVSRRIISPLLVVVMIAALVLAGCGAKEQPAGPELIPNDVEVSNDVEVPKDTDIPEETPEAIPGDEEHPEESPEPIPSDEDIWGDTPEEDLGVLMENDYMNFYYPQEWEGKVEQLIDREGENLVVSYQTRISEKDLVLFSIVVGPAESEGYLLGWLQEGESRINVYSIVNEQDPAQWTEEEYTEICSLQERVNDIIVQFFEDARFVPNR